MIQYGCEAIQVDSKPGTTPEESAKKTYLKPLLVVFGRLESITRFNPGKGVGDNRNKKNTHSGAG